MYPKTQIFSENSRSKLTFSASALFYIALGGCVQLCRGSKEAKNLRPPGSICTQEDGGGGKITPNSCVRTVYAAIYRNLEGKACMYHLQIGKLLALNNSQNCVLFKGYKTRLEVWKVNLRPEGLVVEMTNSSRLGRNRQQPSPPLSAQRPPPLLHLQTEIRL